jgi:hypothetical protein
MPIAPEQLEDCLAHIGVMTDTAFVGVCDELHAAGAAVDGARLLKELQARGVLTNFQVQETEAGRGRDLRVGNYLILTRIGVGGMGTVYKAWHLRMCRVVAIKIMRRDRTQSEQFVTRFLREVQAVARLNHPNIIAAFDAGESSLGDYLVMEYEHPRQCAIARSAHEPGRRISSDAQSDHAVFRQLSGDQGLGARAHPGGTIDLGGAYLRGIAKHHDAALSVHRRPARVGRKEPGLPLEPELQGRTG